MYHVVLASGIYAYCPYWQVPVTVDAGGVRFISIARKTSQQGRQVSFTWERSVPLFSFSVMPCQTHSFGGVGAEPPHPSPNFGEVWLCNVSKVTIFSVTTGSLHRSRVDTVLPEFTRYRSKTSQCLYSIGERACFHTRGIKIETSARFETSLYMDYTAPVDLNSRQLYDATRTPMM